MPRVLIGTDERIGTDDNGKPIYKHGFRRDDGIWDCGSPDWNEGPNEVRFNDHIQMPGGGDGGYQTSIRIPRG